MAQKKIVGKEENSEGKKKQKKEKTGRKVGGVVFQECGLVGESGSQYGKTKDQRRLD